MNRLLSHNLWPTISKLAKNSAKRAAIAYVSSDEHIRFEKGDVLVCDASANAIKTGQTSAAVLKRAFDRGAQIYNLPGLHAKIILLNEKAIIGSANVSGSSASNLIEAGLLTDQPTIVADALSLVTLLASQAQELTHQRIKNLLAIKVVKRPRQKGTAKARVRTSIDGHRTWIIGTVEVDVPEDHQVIVDEVSQSFVERLTNPRSSIEQVSWYGTSRFRKECKVGDWLILIWTPANRSTPKSVWERMPVVGRVDFSGVTYIMYENFPGASRRVKTWKRFQDLVRRVGINRVIKSNSAFEITENQADSLQSLWKDK